ncbi:MAG: ABC transporter ATP-binding protein [Anaerolineales bacterium]|nr:ABC transporter ATP-binding protein [Anaerolineales bacterium]MCB8953012.1 ABC transporter ATP-binding protein [Ardenticatenales bacterium]
MCAIRFEHVSKQFANAPRPAVDDCSFTAEDSGFVVLLGPSGCGKTTLLKMVNRLYEPSAGTIYLNDADIRQMNITDLRRQIGYVIQQIGLFPHMTVAQNIGVVPNLLKWPPTRTRDRVDELLTLVDLPPDEYRDRYPAQMSGGQRQRVGVARALAGDPDVILMDEPFGAIDAITRAGLQDEMLQLQRKLRKTILFVTHDVEEALRLADKIVVMRAGKIVQFDTPFNILSQPANEFVHQLVGADDMVRQLGLIRVAAAMTPLPAAAAPDDRHTISRDDDLRQALSLLLRSRAPALTVTENGRPVGLLTLDNIRHSTGDHVDDAGI